MVITKFQASSGPVAPMATKARLYRQHELFCVIVSIRQPDKQSTDIPNDMADRGGKRNGAGRPPGAVNKSTVDAKARLSQLARQHTGVAFEALVNIAESGNTENARITAACAILDRAFGKPREAGLMQYKAPSSFDDFLGE